MKTSRFCLFLLLLASARTIAEIPPGWSTNLATVLQASATNQQPILLFFTASWCGPCRMMARTTLADPMIAWELDDLSHAAIDIDENPKLAGERGISAVPTFLMLAPDGAEVSRVTGYQTAGEFSLWLSNGVATTQAAVARQKRAKESLAAVDRVLLENDPAANAKVAAQLFDLCADRDEAVSGPAVERLKTLARREPAALLPGLAHPRLAARLRAATILRDTLGETFDIDPWANADVRAVAIDQWRAKLAANRK